MTRRESFLIHHVVIMTHILPWPSMVFYPIRIRMCPNFFMVRPSQGHVLLIRLSYLMIRTCIGKQMNTRVRDTRLHFSLLLTRSIATDRLDTLDHTEYWSKSLRSHICLWLCLFCQSRQSIFHSALFPNLTNRSCTRWHCDKMFQSILFLWRTLSPPPSYKKLHCQNKRGLKKL